MDASRPPDEQDPRDRIPVFHSVDEAFAATARQGWTIWRWAEGIDPVEAQADLLARRGWNDEPPIDPDEVRQLLDRCHPAIAVVQRDLDTTGYGEFQMHAVNTTMSGSEPTVFAALPDGRIGHAATGICPHLDDHSLLGYAAESVTDCLMESVQVFWPKCARHGGRVMRTAPPQDKLPWRGPVSWWCATGPHPVAPVGQLQADQVLPPTHRPTETTPRDTDGSP
jgi:hypothetical protein